MARTCRAPAAVVGENAVDEPVLDVRFDGDEVSPVISAAADRRLAELHVSSVHDIA